MLLDAPLWGSVTCFLFFHLSGEGRCQTLHRKEVKINAEDPQQGFWQEFYKVVVICGVLHHTVGEDY